MKNKDSLPIASFNIECILRSSFNGIEAELAVNPALKLLSRGTRLRYKIVDTDGIERIVEFEKDVIRLLFHFEGSISQAYTKNLATLLAILAMVEGHYQIMLGSLYGYVMEALRSSTGDYITTEQIRTIEHQGMLLESLTSSNRQLSKDFYNCKRLEARLKKDLDAYRAFCLEVLKTVKRSGIPSSKELASTLNISESVATDIIERVSVNK